MFLWRAKILWMHTNVGCTIPEIFPNVWNSTEEEHLKYFKLKKKYGG